MLRFFFLASLLLIPNSLLAAVTINEVAWMGSINSANDEWIELYNDGGSVSVDGWTLSDGQNFNISLLGTIDADEYAVLERTDDSSASGNAFLIYTGALGNDGRTLTLKRADGSIEDQVVGGTDWQNIGGDNVTKETAQYTSSGWVTGKATPGSVNVSAGSVVANNEIKISTNILEKDDGENIYISLVEPDNELSLVIQASETGYVNQPVTFSVDPTGLGERIMDSLVYTWNFGNLATSSGREVKTLYRYPGTYVVIVEAKYTKYTAKARHIITILPTTVSIIENQQGEILIQNNAQYEVDMSGFTIKGNKSLVFPDYTFLAPRATMIMARDLVSDHPSNLIMLYDRAKDVVASSLGSFSDKPPIVSRVSKATSETKLEPITKAKVDETESGFLEDKEIALSGIISATNTTKDLAATPGETVVSPGVAALSTAKVPAEKMPYLGLMGIIAIGILALYSQGHSSKE